VGAQQYAQAWAAAGHQVTVVTTGNPGLAARERVSGVDVQRVPVIGRRARATSTFLSMALYNVSGLSHVLRNRSALSDCDVINCHFSIPTGPLAWVAARLFGRPNVLTIIGGDIYDPSKKSSPHRSVVFRAINRWLMRSADAVIAISSDTKTRAQAYYGVDRPIHVINYGFDPPSPCSDAADRLADAFAGFTLIGIGRLVARKGFVYAIQALVELPDDVRLVIIGDGPLEEELRADAKRLGVGDRVVLTGYMPRTEIAGCLRRADCFILPSLHEGLGIVVQEAMDAGLPVVATNHGGQVDLIRESRNGFLVDPEDSKALAEAVHRLYENRELAQAMGRNNREDIERLHIGANSLEYISVFSELSRAQPALATAG
jgi:glycosyltransferase involved in cell wall biosynthesis